MVVPKVGKPGTYQRVGKCFLRCVGPERYYNWFKNSRKQTITIVWHNLEPIVKATETSESFGYSERPYLRIYARSIFALRQMLA
jgi:hypothetical protein